MVILETKWNIFEQMISILLEKILNGHNFITSNAKRSGLCNFIAYNFLFLNIGGNKAINIYSTLMKNSVSLLILFFKFFY